MTALIISHDSALQYGSVQLQYSVLLIVVLINLYFFIYSRGGCISR